MTTATCSSAIRLIAEGVNLDAYNSVENAARDMYTVAEALGYAEFNYWGTSYGTLLGQYVISQAQEHTASCAAPSSTRPWRPMWISTP